MREIRVTVRRKGYKTRTIIIVTTLLDAELYPANELAALFAARWNCELDLRSIKRVLGMHHSRCQSPEMVRKELWMHLLAYNLIRVRMAQAAERHSTNPRKLSFTAAMNHIQNFAQELRSSCGAERDRLEEQLLKAIAACRVGNRPGRKGPRAIKKRQQKYSYRTQPRAQARKRLAASSRDIRDKLDGVESATSKRVSEGRGSTFPRLRIGLTRLRRRTGAEMLANNPG